MIHFFAEDLLCPRFLATIVFFGGFKLCPSAAIYAEKFWCKF
jgi:hypothetical protein